MRMRRKGDRTAWRMWGIGWLAATSLLLAACGGGNNDNNNTNSTAGSTTLSTGWEWPGGDPKNSRAVGGPINASNVSTLGVAWTVPITASGAFGGYSSTPVVVDDVVYTQDLESNVQAIDFKTGKVRWTHKFNSANIGPNGVTVANGNVYGATGD